MKHDTCWRSVRVFVRDEDLHERVHFWIAVVLISHRLRLLLVRGAGRVRSFLFLSVYSTVVYSSLELSSLLKNDYRLNAEQDNHWIWEWRPYFYNVTVLAYRNSFGTSSISSLLAPKTFVGRDFSRVGRCLIFPALWHCIFSFDRLKQINLQFSPFKEMYLKKWVTCIVCEVHV